MNNETSDDRIVRFTFNELPVRGQYLRLTRSWLDATAAQHYPAAVRRKVGEAMAVATLLADGIKFDGRVALQATTDGEISMLLGECAQRHVVRGIARMSEANGNEDAITPELGNGRLAISLIPERGEMHQGVVELTENSIAPAVEHYFEHSEQLPTRIEMASDDRGITALLLQRLPDTSPLPSGKTLDGAVIDEHWERLETLFASCRTDELLTLQAEQLLYRLFHLDTLSLHPPRSIKFGCSCTRSRSEAALKLLGKEDLTALSNETDEISVSCEMCGKTYTWDSVEAHVLFETHTPRMH